MLVVDSGGTTSCRNSPKGVACTCAGVQRVKGLKKLLCKALETPFLILEAHQNDS